VISQIELVGAIFTELDRQGMQSLAARQMNAVINHVNEIIREIESPPRMSSPGMGLQAWLASDDTGMSSEFMAATLSGQFSRRYAHPYDLDDFGRCMRLLEAAPEFRDRLDFMKTKSTEWKNLVASWQAIVDAITQEKWMEGYAILRQCIAVEASTT
jgi:hypothetical protein